MESSNLSSRFIGGNNGYRPLPLSNQRLDGQFSADYQNVQSPYRTDFRNAAAADMISDSSDEDSVSTNGSDIYVYTESDDRLEEWQKNVKSDGELFYIDTYSEDATGQSVYNSSSSSENKTRKNQLANSEVRSSDIGILSSLKWRPKQQNLKKSQLKDQNAGSTSKTDDKNENFRKIFKEVFINLPQKRPNLGRGVSPFEGILGLVLKRTFRKGISMGESQSSDNIMIINIISESPSSAVSDIRIGDRIVSINDVEINYSNLEHISCMALAVGCKQVKLGVCRIELVTPKEDKTAKCTTRSSANFLPKLLSNQDEYWSEVNNSMKLFPHMAAYLNLTNCDASERREDVLYQFPRGENKLIDIRGALVTLVKLMPDVVGSQISTSTFWTGTKVMHVAYAQDNQDGLMVLAMPSDCVSLSEIRRIADEVVSTLKFQFGNLDRAFEKVEQRSQLDLLFALLFSAHTNEETPLNLCSVKKLHRGSRSHLPQQLPLSTDLQICIDAVLNEFESSDFADMSEVHYDIRRLYSIIGVSLYFKGFLVSNHLTKSHSLDIFLYLLHSGMLDTSRQHLTNIIVWKEVFPSEFGCSGSDKRCFLLVVGKHHFLLAVILESGGCASRAIGPQAPDPFYVERAQATLLQLQLHQITNSLSSTIDVPSISCMAQMKKGHNISRCCSEKKSDNAGSKQGAANRVADFHNFEVIGDTDSDSTSVLSTAASGTSDDTAPILGRRVQCQADNDFRMGPDRDSIDENLNRSANLPRQRQLPSFLDLSTVMDALPVSTNERITPPARLLSGSPSVLFNFLQVSHGNGVIICPVSKDNDAAEQFLSLKEIIENFERGCEMISQILNCEEEPVVEHGMLFQCSKSSTDEGNKQHDLISYWIVGRLFKDACPKEVYVCYQDLCPQSLVEIAFRLSFGTM